MNNSGNRLIFILQRAYTHLHVSVINRLIVFRLYRLIIIIILSPNTKKTRQQKSHTIILIYGI